MRAAVVRAPGETPVLATFDDPVPAPDERLVEVSASAINPITLSRAAGVHYSAHSTYPFVPGVDGVGRTSEGLRVYFRINHPTYGALAEKAPVERELMVPLADGLEDVPAAAAGIPGLSCWTPLTTIARIPAGGSVLVNGATGSSGLMAVQVAKHLGAHRVIATGREPSKLAKARALGADLTVPLTLPPEEFRDVIRREATESSLAVVLDYLWGPSAGQLLAALGGPGAPRGPERIRYVSIGAISGAQIPLDSALLRSSGVELVGSGIGSASLPTMRRALVEFLDAFARNRFQIDTDPHSLEDLPRLWGRTGTDRRLVFTLP